MNNDSSKFNKLSNSNVSTVQNIYQISKKDIHFGAQKNAGSEYGYPNKKRILDHKNNLQKQVKGLRNNSEQESKSFDQVDV